MLNTLKCILFISFFVVISTSRLFSKSYSPDIEEYLDGFHKLYGLSGHVKIMEGDIVVFDAHYGYKEHETKKKHTKNPQFKIGSISKQFIAASILQLAHKELISLTDVIDSYSSRLQ